MVLNTLTLETSRVLTLTISETIGMKNEYIVNSHKIITLPGQYFRV